MSGELTLSAGDCRLVLAPERGGSVSRLDWRGEPILRPTCGPSILDTACFPLVPFSNRIAHGRFYADDAAVVLDPNFPGQDHPHPLHGFGWLAAWDVVTQEASAAVLRHDHPAGMWPWTYRAEQHFALSPTGLRHSLSLTNFGDTPMPAGLGLHPYFLRADDTTYHGLHRGEWQTAADGLPIRLECRDTAVDWWQGRPADTRVVDTVYTKREGALTISWPSRALAVTMRPSDELSFTVVYTPAGADYLCVEPVSHATDAINMRTAEAGYRWLDPSNTWTVWIHYEVMTR